MPAETQRTERCRMNRFIVMVAAAGMLTAVFGSGCSTSRYGDAMIINRPICAFPEDFIQTTHSFRLPRVELGERHEYRFRVRGLKERTYPNYFYMEVPREEYYDNPPNVHKPWRSCVLTVQLLYWDGEPFFTKRIELQNARRRTAERHPSASTGIIGVEIYSKKTLLDLPYLTSYDAVVRVEYPSKRKTDWGYFTYGY